MSEPVAPKQHGLADLIIPALAVVFTGYYMTTIVAIPWIAQAGAVVVGTALVVCVAALIIRIFRRFGREGTDGHAPIRPVQRRTIAKAFILLGLSAFFVLILPWLGVGLAAAVFLFASIVALSSMSNWKRAAITAIAGGLIVHVVFDMMLALPFPQASGMFAGWSG